MSLRKLVILMSSTDIFMVLHQSFMIDIDYWKYIMQGFMEHHKKRGLELSNHLKRYFQLCQDKRYYWFKLNLSI